MSAPYLAAGFSPATQRAYTEGSCWYLALALEALSGLEPVAIWAEGGMHHAGVRLHTGDVLDIAGVWTAPAWAAYWEARLGAASVASASAESEHWFLASQLYDETMLDVEITEDGTLVEVARRLLRAAEAAGTMSTPTGRG